MLTLADIEAAAQRLSDVAVKTPLLANALLNERVGGRVLLKARAAARTGPSASSSPAPMGDAEFLGAILKCPH